MCGRSGTRRWSHFTCNNFVINKNNISESKRDNLSESNKNNRSLSKKPRHPSISPSWTAIDNQWTLFVDQIKRKKLERRGIDNENNKRNSALLARLVQAARPGHAHRHARLASDPRLELRTQGSVAQDEAVRFGQLPLKRAWS